MTTDIAAHLRCVVWLLLIATLTPSLAQAADVKSIRVGKAEFQHITLSPTVSYFISKTPTPSALVLYIQGSGCEPALFEYAPGKYGSTVLSLSTAAADPRFAVMIVQKPFEPKQSTGSRGTMKGCPSAFNDYHSFETWLSTIKQAYQDALTQPWVRPDRHLVLGISEGADMAAALAASEPSVTHVALHGATGTTQIFDFIAGAYTRKVTDEERLAEIAAFERGLAEINASPDSTTSFAWGHTFKHWSSFLKQSTLALLERSKARVYLVSGMADTNVPTVSTEVLYANLVAQGRNPTFRRVPNADHMLYPTKGKFESAEVIAGVEREYATIRDWYLAN